MAVILAQTATGTSNLASTTVTFSNNTVNGNTIVIFVGNSSTTPGDVSGITDSQGNHYTKIQATAFGTLGEIEIWYTTQLGGIIGGANTITVAYTTGVSCAVIAREYWGILGANALDKNTSTTGSGTSASSGNIQLVQPIELLVGVAQAVAGSGFSVGSGFGNLTTQNDALSVFTVAVEDQFVTSIGPWAATFGLASGSWICGVASFYQLPHGTTTSTSFTTSTSMSSTSQSSTSSSISTTSNSTSMSSTSTSLSITTVSTSSTSSSVSSTSISSTSSSTSISSTSTSVSSTSVSSTSQSSTSSSTSVSSTSTSFSSTSSSVSSTSSSVSSTSFSSTSSSSSTSTTTLPPPYYDYTYQDEGSYTVVQQFTPTSPTTWVCPANVTSVLAECWGGAGGGGGADDSAVAATGGGGGGGGYSNATVSVTPGTSYTVTVGAGGTGGLGSAGTGGALAGGNGGDSSFLNTSTVLAKAGLGGGAGNSSSQGAGGAGGAASSGVGTIKNSGGAGTNGNSNGIGGPGGSSAGTNGNGNTGVSGTGAVINAAPPLGGRGGTSQASGFPPGGGGGGADEAGTGGTGAGGLVQLTYTTTQSPQTTNTDLVNKFNAHQYGEVSTGDGDYLITTGSKYLIQEYKDTHTNNTDNITFTWIGRSTISTILSPLLIQIFNQNSQIWETIASQTLIPADTDFQLQAVKNTNVSNYYDSNNIVTFRSYQQVV